MNEKTPGETLRAHIAQWPEPCIDCLTVVRRGEPMVFREGHKHRWCMSCAAHLQPQPAKPTRQYTDRYAGQDRAATAATSAPRANGRVTADAPDPLPVPENPADLVGRRVRVKAGAAIVADANPRSRPGSRTQRAQTVVVDHVLAATTAKDGRLLPAAIRWSAAGGYYRGTAVGNIDYVVD